MFVITAIILLVFKIVLASKDANSYLLKEVHGDNANTLRTIKRWHRDGFILDSMFTLILMYASHDWLTIGVQSILIRLAIFDLAFNYFAKLNIHYLGSTAFVDKIFVKMFGVNGAVQKSILFLAATVVWGLIKLWI